MLEKSAEGWARFNAKREERKFPTVATALRKSTTQREIKPLRDKRNGRPQPGY